MSNRDLVIVLIPGGESALFEKLKDGISLEDLQELNKLLLRCGVNTREVNTVRKHVSDIKGSQLIKHLYPAKVLALIISDVVDDPIELVVQVQQLQIQ